jgi:hypothetical protein
MTDSTEVQSASKPTKVSLDDRIAEVQRAVRDLDDATDDLVWALERLDDQDVSASVRELAASMLQDAWSVRHDFECGDFSDHAEELETLAEEEDEEDEEDEGASS